MSASLQSKDTYQPFQVVYRFDASSEAEDSDRMNFLYKKVFENIMAAGPGRQTGPKNFPPEVDTKWAILLNLIVYQGVLLRHIKDLETIEHYCTERAKQALTLLKKLNNPKAELTAADGRFLGSLFVLDPEYVRAGQEMTAFMRQKLLLLMPGKTAEEQEKYMKANKNNLPADIQDLIEEAEEFAVNFQQERSDFTRRSDIATASLLSQTEFFDECLDKNCIPAMEVLARLFNRQPSILEGFLTIPDRYLKRQRSDWDARGYQYIIRNMAFAQVIRDKVATDKWAEAGKTTLLVALSANAFHRRATSAVMTDFIQKANTLPPMGQTLLAQIISVMVQDICFPEIDPEEKTDFLPDLKIDNLFPLLAHTRSVEIRQNLITLFESFSADKVRTVWNAAQTDQDRVIFFRLLNETEKGRAFIPVLNDGQDGHSVWRLVDRGLIRDDEMEPVIRLAIRDHRTAFLLEPKNRPLTPSFPAYDALKTYFHRHPKGLSFIAGFKHPHMTPSARLYLATDFVPDRPLALAGLYGVIPYWAATNSEEKIVSFLFEGDLKHQQNIRPRFAAKDLNRLMTTPDESGKTPWHYVCERKSRLLFGRHFKALYPSFLQALQQRDKNGLRPLDLIGDNLKYRQMIVEKIPAAEKIMIENGLSLVYEPPVPRKKADPIRQPLPAPEPQTPAPQPQPVKSSWIVRKIGNDKNRKDESYLAEIQSKIDLLPSPEEIGRVSLSNVTVKKKCFEATTFKIRHNNKFWRVPFVHNAETKTVYILPGSDQDDTYTNQDYIRLVRNLAKRVRRQEQYNSRQRA